MSSSDDEGPSSPGQPPTDPESSDLSSDEFPITHMMKVGIFSKGGKTSSSGHKTSRDTSQHGALGGTAVHCCLPRALAAVLQCELFGNYIVSYSKSSSTKMPNIAAEKKGVEPIHLPHAAPRKKLSRKKKSFDDSISKFVMKRKSQGYRSYYLPTPITFPPISGFPVADRARKNPLASLPRQLKPQAGKNPMESRTSESEQDFQEETNPKKEPAPKGFVPSSRPGPSCQFVHRGVGNYRESKTKLSQIPRRSPHLLMVPKDVRPRVTLSSGDHEPPLHFSRQEKNQSPAEMWCCPQCPVLQREINGLKDKVVAMQHVINKLQIS